ncbi:MAG: 50S ribosomal protein L6 [Gammaproteobacteria bacterium]
MSRIAKQPVEVPNGVEVNINGLEFSAKGPKGFLSVMLHKCVDLKNENNILTFSPRDESNSAMAIAGTTRSVVSNMITGVLSGYEKKLVLVGVGYRAQLQGAKLSLSLGFSHPVVYQVPEGIQIECVSPTEITVRGCSKQQVGQASAEIRAFRPPEPYKGKGVKYADEQIIRKEAKKK